MAVMTKDNKIAVVTSTIAPNKSGKLAYTNIFDNLSLEKVELMAKDETDGKGNSTLRKIYNFYVLYFIS